MKVLMVDSLVGNDYSLCLCQALHESGVDVIFVTTEDREVGEEYDFPVRYMAPSKGAGKNKAVKLLKYVRYLFELSRLPRREGADVLHFQFFRRDKLESLMFPLLRLLGVNLVHTAHNVLPHESGRIDYLLKNFVYRSSHQIIVHSQYIKDKLLRTFPNIDRDKVAIVPHGNFDIYLPPERFSKAEARHKLGLPADHPILLFFGYIRAYKGVDLLLEAFDQAATVLPNLTLVVAGKPHSKELGTQFANQIEAMAAKNRVKYVPAFIPNEEVSLYFDAADAIALPYKHIDHSGIVHLAYSFGKPIIATEVGDFKETLEEDQSGFVAPPNDAAGLAHAIKDAFCDPVRLQQLGHHIEELNRTKYAWAEISRKTGEVYRNGKSE